MRLRRACLPALILSALSGMVAPPALHAAQAVACDPGQKDQQGTCAAPGPTQQMPTITVSATLNPRPVGEVAADVSVITREEMDRHLVDDLRDLVRYEPGVSATSTPGRYGENGISIRGLGGNRVAIEIDGVPISDSYTFGSMLSAGRDLVDLDSIERVEIVRGPASSLYGSDALGGVVSYFTKDPADYLRDGRSRYFSLKGQYDTVNRGSAGSATFATGDERNGFMLLATHRDADQTNNMGDVDTADSTRTRPDPQRLHSNNVLAKYVHGADSGRVDRLTLDLQRDNGLTTLWSAISPPIVAFSANDEAERGRLSFRQVWKSLDTWFADSIDWQGWGQYSDVDQDSLETRDNGPGYERHVASSFTQREWGLQLHAFKHAEAAGATHDFTWGLEWSRVGTEELRDGFAINLTDGSTSNTIAGGNADNYPARDFPPADTTNAAVFVQDEISLAGGTWRLVPGLRYDHYRFAPQPDALFDSQPLSEHVEGQTDQHVSPKLGVVWQLAEHFNMYAQYATGFRAPPYSDLGLSFSNLRFGYAAIPNPDLAPETSRGIELGLRGEGDLGSFTIAVYDNRYDNFIDSMHMIPHDQWPLWAVATPGLFIVFQSVNLTEARIQGAEASGVLYLGSLSDALEGWRLQGSLGAARGDAREVDGVWAPLDSIDPARAILGISYEGYDWGIELDTTAVARKDRLADPDAFHAPGYTTIDLYAHWSPVPSLNLYASLTNLTNRKYWDWGNLHGGTIGSTPDSSAVIDRYTAPGRAFSISARWTF